MRQKPKFSLGSTVQLVGHENEVWTVVGYERVATSLGFVWYVKFRIGKGKPIRLLRCDYLQTLV